MPLSPSPEDPLRRPLLLGNHVFPGIWQYLLPAEFMLLDLPEERQATCMSCPKVCDDQYRPDYRCCTYHPRVANYALGLALETKPGKRAFEKAAAMGMLTPEGMNHSPSQYLDYLYDLQDEVFGKSQRVLCPMLDQKTGYCNIHAFRNGVCSTFFCIKDHGDRGEKFWSDVQSLVCQAEIALSQWCLHELGFDLAAYIKAYDRLARNIKKASDPQTGGLTRSAQQTLWGAYFGRERELYRACAQLISEHRDVLWEIASSFEIRESKKFDQATTNLVPAELQEQIDDDDLDDDQEAISCQELWQTMQRRYRSLWQLPQKPLKLSSRVMISPNPKDTPRDQQNANKPFLLQLLSAPRSKDEDFRAYLTFDEARLLECFTTGQAIDWRLLASEPARALTNPRKFLAEASGNRILITCRT